MSETAMSWDYPLRRIKELEASAYHDLLTTGETDAVEKMAEFERQWIHSQLPRLLTAWSRMDNETKRTCIDELEKFGHSLRSVGGSVAGESAATRIAQIIEMLGNMTPEFTEHASQSHARLVGS